MGIFSNRDNKKGYCVFCGKELSDGKCTACGREAKEVVSLCDQAGVKLTDAGATFPYGKDPENKNIRLSPSFPPVEELDLAMQLFTLCCKLATAEKLLG